MDELPRFRANKLYAGIISNISFAFEVPRKCPFLPRSRQNTTATPGGMAVLTALLEMLLTFRAGMAFIWFAKRESLLACQVLVQLALFLSDDLVDTCGLQFGVELIQSFSRVQRAPFQSGVILAYDIVAGGDLI